MASRWTEDSGRRLSRRRAITLGGGAVAAALAAVGLPGRSARSEGVLADESNPVEGIHGIGVTGEGVRVGVLDPTGFDPGHPALVDSVTGLR
ncbi:hypothetical protein ACFR9S_14985, partial [Halolamina salina]